MYSGLLSVVGSELTKRAMDRPSDPPANAGIPPLAFVAALLNMAIFLPLIVFVTYTLGTVYPTLAMIEDPDPNPSPAYAALPPQDEALNEPLPGAAVDLRKPDDEALAAPGLVTTSLRATTRHLYRLGGWRFFLRGLFCAWVISFATLLVGGIFSSVPFVPFFIGTLLANLALVQLHTAWVHIVISTRPFTVAFWRRLPPFRRTFDATKHAVLAFWLATTATYYLTYAVAWLVGLPINLSPGPVADGDGDSSSSWPGDSPAWKHLLVLSVVIACELLFKIPAHVALVRVQASILPPEEDTVVPFDRSFGGLVEPAVVDSSAAVSVRDALRTFSRASWVRLYKLLAKILLVSIATIFLMVALLIPQSILLGMSGSARRS